MPDKKLSPRQLPDGRYLPPGFSTEIELGEYSPLMAKGYGVPLLGGHRQGSFTGMPTAEAQNRLGIDAFLGAVNDEDLLANVGPAFRSERKPGRVELDNSAALHETEDDFEDTLASRLAALDPSARVYRQGPGRSDIFNKMVDAAYRKTGGKSSAYEDALPPKLLKNYVKTHPRPLVGPDIEAAMEPRSLWDVVRFAATGRRKR